jgi:hypothetical protein
LERDFRQRGVSMKSNHRVWSDGRSPFPVFLPVGTGVILTSSVNNVDITCH